MHKSISTAVTAIEAIHVPENRILIAVAGPPATGKSTFSDALVQALNERNYPASCVVPMDGYHLDNLQLDRLGLMPVKGAPETFDFDGFRCLLERLRVARTLAYYPIFDRERDLAIAGAGAVLPDTEIIIVEGNYLMLDNAPWNDLAQFFDIEFFLETAEARIKERLVDRWLAYGYDQAGAQARALSNDIPNMKLVLGNVRASTKAHFIQAD